MFMEIFQCCNRENRLVAKQHISIRFSFDRILSDIPVHFLKSPQVLIIFPNYIWSLNKIKLFFVRNHLLILTNGSRVE